VGTSYHTAAIVFRAARLSMAISRRSSIISALLRRMAADPSLRDIPVVIMSSLAEATVAERCAGYTAFLRKPFSERLIGAP
jgi:hypothetical protein